MRCHGLDAVGEIYLAWWLANAGLRACRVAQTVQLCRGNDTEPKFVLARERFCWK